MNDFFYLIQADLAIGKDALTCSKLPNMRGARPES